MVKTKISEQDKIQAHNITEEIKEILEPCINCGMCKSKCPVFKILREEFFSPRGKVSMLSNEVIEDVVFQCNLCKACEKTCSLDIKICEAIKKSREVLVLKNKGLNENNEMIKNIRKTGNPFGKNPEKAEKLYCC